MLKGFREPFHVCLMLKGLFQTIIGEQEWVILEANLIAMDVTVHFKCLPIKSYSERKRDCSVYVALRDYSFGIKLVICLAQQQMLYINYLQKSLENNFLNDKRQGEKKAFQ